MPFFSVVIYPSSKIEFCFTKITLHPLLSKIPTSQNSYSDVLHDFQQVAFHTQNTIFVFHNIQRFIVIQKFNSHHRRGF